ncbi:hypothetical protein CFAM422_003419 [Trichoderma lentiforme]|uniref:Uncharacterized protein n=1 Tax=Trichoderma lentiforme TaxID=1567552 RepID=A0A9P4XHX7_9HYPO|nr:hypothetical protein CFAM422_003419 [Trichoderma lentiforme]
MGPCQRVGTWTAKGGYANWCHDLLCSPLLAAACDERRLEWFRGPKWCAIDAACRAGDGNHARGAQASEPGPTWTHQRFGLIAWDKHIYLREPTRFDHARSGLVWLQGMASLFLYEAGPTDWSSSIHSHSRTEQGKVIGFLASLLPPSSPQRDTKAPPKTAAYFEAMGEKKQKPRDPPSTRAGGSAEGFWKTRQTVLAHLVGGIVGYGLLRSASNGTETNHPPGKLGAGDQIGGSA